MNRLTRMVLWGAACAALTCGCSQALTDLLADVPVAQDLVETTAQDVATNADAEPGQDVAATEIPEQDVSLDFGAADEGSQCPPGAGCFGDPCKDGTDCLSGFCLEHMGEGQCSMPCEEECPSGFECKQVGRTDPDIVYVCVSSFANLCKPCVSNADCKGTSSGNEDVCIEYGAEGKFCGGACQVHADCPWGFSCKDATTVGGVTLKQCTADAGVCPCTSRSIELGLYTSCAATNEWGTCGGKRVCAQEGLAPCDAQTPAEETCNGLDDNCDGDVDEALFEQGQYVDLCDDGNDCTDDLCGGESGCSHVAQSGIECKDGNPCTVADNCQLGICVGTLVDCDDENPCTDDACDDTGGCVYADNQAKCDDADPCTVADQCAGGQCSGFAVACDCVTDTDCDALEDGDVCNGSLYCATDQVPFQCAVLPDSAITCPAPSGSDGPCLSATCDGQTGDCSFAPGPNGAPCEDMNACTVGDTCAGGKCTPGSDANCNDGNPCTDDTCEPAQGCVHTDNSDPCNDGDACTTGDTCTAGACAPLGVLACDDGNPCTADVCDPQTGCQHTAQEGECDDGNACTELDLCVAGTCKGMGAPNCNDSNPCTADSCLPETGCMHTFADGGCTDGNPCTVNDTCVKGKCQSGTLLDCDDGNPCTADACTSKGICEHTPLDAACDDGNACTLGDHCLAGKCATTGMLDCGDDDVCTDDECDAQLGCLTTLNTAPCDDGNLCTYGDACQMGACVAAGTLKCDDGNPCTADTCDPAQECVHTPLAAACDDGNPCTIQDACSQGKCMGVKPLNCNDGNVCTDDSCDPMAGCVHAPNDALCSDGDVCTTGDSCAAGSCVPGPQVNCNDGNVCTDDACDVKLGCQHVPNTASCEDGDECTANDVCSQALCAPGGAVVCADGNVCTDDSCDSKLGCLHAVNTAKCDDGNACTVNDVCSNASCKAGTPVTCNDNNLCTDDSCSPLNGCVFLPNTAACDDKDACTTGDQCKNGGCAPGGPTNCDDSNPCTSDSCSAVTGCGHVNVPDGTGCGGTKTCVAGVCTDCPNLHGSVTFNFTGGQQSWTVPLCVTQVNVEVWGAQGGGSTCCSGTDDDGGLGGYSKGTLAVAPGEVLYVYVGSKGVMAGAGGWNGGGAGGQYGGGGGGATDIRKGGTGLNERKIVGGGGGAGNCGCPDHGHGGGGGGLNGIAGIKGPGNSGVTPGGGGTQSSGGTAGTSCNPGTFGNGGSNANYHFAGGGGGWYGGGCAYASGGGGGSGYVGGVSDGTTSADTWVGNGKAVLTW
jgi:hypothetical protein